MKNRIIAAGVIAASILSYSSSSFAQTKTFPDVQTGHWAEDSINYLAEKGAVTGNEKGMFEPGKEITRAEAATMMAKILNLPIDKNAKPSYADSQKHWATPIIAAVEKAGVVKGTGNGFEPDGKIDRVSMASLLVEAYKLESKVNGTPATKFKDLETLNWGKEKANILVELGISVGTGDKWEPKKILTKAEAAQFIKKADSLKVGNPLVEKVVIIDPGHGGFDPGNPGQGVEESKIVFDTSLRLQKLLEKNTPLKALLTREENGNPGSNKNESLANRVKFGQENNADIFVSIHANSSEKHDGHGTETYYYKKSKRGEETQIEKDSEVLAKKIQNRVVEALHTRDRKIKDDHSLYVVNNNTVPAVLTELAFIDNDIDNGKLATESGRQIAAEAVYAGILDYYEWKGFDVSKYRLAK
ncbi:MULTISPECIES: N-acetylmuramoyl-L-alanine amidase [Bacillus]|uniref:N-acetylmuramoyl-L-alanine amidase, family 3 n=11 Tax=Bacillus cereus group TaxID=86661 RepID=A0AAC8SGI8_BACAN|nr:MULTISPECIES: N-acetylmuramoyl-L-alanine amidase [Bacillus]EDX58050.1 N-acetylmuramoyl-L-alanine amidase, family 3 [Bacillus cereus W]EJT20303.1 N-acetylmuramoyl-L-alanine amidase family protein [Bacillus anthracis str. UR-1]EXJ20465.1 N-acetylmuramoyl-L-alanine amidase [Bacillus anthracis str. 95014]AAP25724.1 N-acetylmuramoyl-L-alanine amidase, family 3 [Bacillus anthracis str. Ames]AAT30929.1 N-acetylmuramoyl-L-alanine amidase, family 3 [Bacillus anthracis str. 'Ames Ancestor']